MDINLMTCPECRHAVNDASGICAYCGAPISEGEPDRQIDEKTPREEMPGPETLLLPEETPTPLKRSETRSDAQPLTAETSVQQRVPLSNPEPGSEIMQKLTRPEIETKPENEPAFQEEILLTLDAEVRPGFKDSPESVGITEQSNSDEDHTGTNAAKGKAETSGEIPREMIESLADSEAYQKRTQIETMDEISKIEKAAQDMEAALNKQKAAMIQAQSLTKDDVIQTKAEAEKRKRATLVKAQALKKQKMAQADLESSKKTDSAAFMINADNNDRRIPQGLEAEITMTGLLKKYEGQSIGINYDNSAEVKKARLVVANDEFFSVFVEDNDLQYTYPLKTILTVIEGKDGVATGGPEQKSKIKAIIKIYPLLFFMFMILPFILCEI